MIDVAELFKMLIAESEMDNSKDVYKLKPIYFQRPFLLIGLDLLTLERRLYVDITDEDWNKEQLNSFPKWKGLSITAEHFEKIGQLEDKTFLVIAQASDQSEEIIEKVLQSLIDHIFVGGESALYMTVYEVLDRWHNFFRNKTDKRLSLEEQMGVFGELYYIQNYLTKLPDYPPLVIDYWEGPTRGRVDFVKNGVGVEIKTSSPKIRNEIRISSEKQLELNPVIKSIYLYVLEVEAAQTDGQTIQQLIDLIRRELVARAPSSLVKFNDLLLGLYIVDGVYDDTRFYVHKETAFEVKESFPRITSEHVPVGVSNLSYTIDLSHCLDFQIDPEKIYYLGREG